jgi:spermidine/putrescine transport system permease protein
VAALTYNFLPFMVLPIYVSLEKMDRRLLEAAADLYSSPARAFRRVTLPLSLPGLFAGTLLTFIPAAGDFVNSELLGSERTVMIGNIIEKNFGKEFFRPELSALSFMLMAIILVGVIIYARILGTEDLA